MRSSFEDLIARSQTVKTDRNFDIRFKSYGFFFSIHMKLNAWLQDFSFSAGSCSIGPVSLFW